MNGNRELPGIMAAPARANSGSMLGEPERTRSLTAQWLSS
jgi:hypothetical protein